MLADADWVVLRGGDDEHSRPVFDGGCVSLHQTAEASLRAQGVLQAVVANTERYLGGRVRGEPCTHGHCATPFGLLRGRQSRLRVLVEMKQLNALGTSEADEAVG